MNLVDIKEGSTIRNIHNKMKILIAKKLKISSQFIISQIDQTTEFFYVNQFILSTEYLDQNMQKSYRFSTLKPSQLTRSSSTKEICSSIYGFNSNLSKPSKISTQIQEYKQRFFNLRESAKNLALTKSEKKKAKKRLKKKKKEEIPEQYKNWIEQENGKTDQKIKEQTKQNTKSINRFSQSLENKQAEIKKLNKYNSQLFFSKNKKNKKLETSIEYNRKEDIINKAKDRLRYLYKMQNMYDEYQQNKNNMNILPIINIITTKQKFSSK